MIRNRILLVTNLFPPDIGGPASFIPDLADRLFQQGYPVTVVCQSDTPTHPDDEIRPYRVHRIQRMKYRLNRLWVALNLLWLVPRHDVIFCNTLDESLAPVCWLLRRSYILKIVGDRAWEAARNRGLTNLSIDDFQSVRLDGVIARLAERRARIARRASRVIVPSEYLRQLVIGWGIAPHQVTTVLNGIRLDEFEDRHPQRREDGPLKIIFVGRLVNWKGVDSLIDALIGLDNVHLTIVGEGPEYASLERQALATGSSIVFTKKVSRDEALRLMAKSHVLVLVSSYEGLSHTLLETCAIGLPCITSDRGGNPEVIEHDKNGLIVPYGDVAALRAAILYLRDNETERFRLAQDARRRSQHFDFEKTVRDTIRVLLPNAHQHHEE